MSRKGKGYSIVLALMLAVVLCGCGMSAENKKVVTSNAETLEAGSEIAARVKKVVAKKGLEDDLNVATTYAAFLMDGEFGEYSSYYIYDVDNDGCEELIVIDATCEADARMSIWTYEKSGEVHMLGSTDGAHCSICGNEKEDGIIIHYGIQGIEWINTVKIENGNMAVTELIGKRSVSEYSEFDYCISLECYDIGDMTPFINYGVDKQQLSNVIDLNFNMINTSASAYLKDYSYRGGRYLSGWESSKFTAGNRSVYNLELTGAETNYYLYNDYTTITARGDTIVGVSQSGFQVSSIDNTYQLLKWLGGAPEKLLNYEP